MRRQSVIKPFAPYNVLPVTILSESSIHLPIVRSAAQKVNVSGLTCSAFIIDVLKFISHMIKGA